jgi:hypothetical protein
MRRQTTARDGPVPGSIKLAAALFVVYGVSAFLNAAVVLRGAGWTSPLGWIRALIQLIGAGLIAWGLLRGARWAWGLGLLLGVFWLVTGALTTLVVQRGDLHWLSPSGFQLLLSGSLVCLGVAVALLLTPAARAVFRRPAA